MAPSERAQKNHDELFPGHVSTLAVTDPELIEIFDNFAFDEVPGHGKLEIRTRLMVQLASMIASQAVREYRAMLGAALNVGVTPVQVKEIVYQAVPYIGMAKVFDFIHATNEVLTTRGIKLPLPGRFRSRSSAAIQWRNFMRRLPQTNSTSSATSLPTASAIITLARASTYPHASC